MLINCPNCGKPISDTARECPHCKTILAGKREKCYYVDLSREEQIKLEKEYAKENTCKTVSELNSALAMANKIKTILFIIVMACVVAVVVPLFKYSSMDFSDIPSGAKMLIICGIVLAFILTIVACVFSKKRKKTANECIIRSRAYKLWLEDRNIYFN